MTDADPNNSDCFWFPDLAKCQDDGNNGGEEGPVVVDPTDPDNKGEIDGENMTPAVVTGASVPILGQIAYLTVSALLMSGNLLKAIRWRKDTTGGASYYIWWTSNESELGSTNYWSLANMIQAYGGLAVWGVLFITQLISTFGIMGEINMMAWELGGFAYTLTEAIFSILMFLAMMKASSVNGGSSSSATAAGTILLELQKEWLFHTAAMTFATMIAFSQ